MLAPEQFFSELPGRISLASIDAVVSAKLGPTRVRGNAPPAVFNRQVAMYLGKYIGGWSTTAIGRFYNGRDHSTVCYSIKRVESKRESIPEFAQLIEELSSAIQSTGPPQQPSRSPKVASADEWLAGLDEGMLNALAERITDRVLRRIVERLRIAQTMKDGQSSGNCPPLVCPCH
jgi:hypothetical protein